MTKTIKVSNKNAFTSKAEDLQGSYWNNEGIKVREDMEIAKKLNEFFTYVFIT